MRSVENKAFLLERVSSTFHGRDLFAPAAAWLASGKDFRDLGPELHEFQREAWNDPVRVQLGWQTEVIHVDGYGNAITAFRADHPHRVRSVLLADGRRLPLEQFYGAVAKGSALRQGVVGFRRDRRESGERGGRTRLGPGERSDHCLKVLTQACPRADACGPTPGFVKFRMPRAWSVRSLPVPRAGRPGGPS